MEKSLQVVAMLVMLSGLVALALLLTLLPVHTVSSPKEITSLVANQKVSTQSDVAIETIFQDNRSLILENGLEVHSATLHAPLLKGKLLVVIGTVQHYQNKTWIEAHTIRITR